jgi:hypothetical protein
VADEYTPTTDEVCEAYSITVIDGSVLPERAAEFYRWLAAHEAELRERIARQLDAEQQRARAAHQAADADHFAHDYCRWVGHAEALGNAARIARGATR